MKYILHYGSDTLMLAEECDLLDVPDDITDEEDVINYIKNNRSVITNLGE